jgi:hypothetical protein
MLAQKHRMSSHSCDGCFGRDSCPGTALVEHDSYSLSRESSLEIFGYRPRLDRMLVRGRIADQSCELGGRKVCNRQEMARVFL